MCNGNNVGRPLYSRTAGQTLTYIMTSRSTSLEPKSQLIINLDPGWECQSLPSEENTKRRKIPNPRKGEDTKKKKTERKFPMKEWEKKKRKRKILEQGSEENKRNMQKGLWASQYLNNTELSPPNKERKETTTWSGPLPLIADKLLCASDFLATH